MNQKQSMKKKAILGAGEYGCWECTLVPQVPDEGVKNPEQRPEKLWVFARNLKEITGEIPGVESAVLIGKAVCLADILTPGVDQPGQEVQQAIDAAKSQPEFRKCPYCGKTYLLEIFVKPDGISDDLLLCPNEHCKMLSRPERLIKVNS